RSDERGARQVHIVSGRSRHDAQGRFLGYRGVGRDVTEQRTAERKLFQAKARLEVALDGGNLAEWHFDARSGELYAGDGWARFLGQQRSAEAMPGRELLPLVHPDDLQQHREAVITALKTGQLDAQFRMQASSGE